MKNNKLHSALIGLGMHELAASIYQVLLDRSDTSITDLCTQTGQDQARVSTTPESRIDVMTV